MPVTSTLGACVRWAKWDARALARTLSSVGVRSVACPVVQVKALDVLEGLKRQDEGNVMEVGVVSGLFL